ERGGRVVGPDAGVSKPFQGMRRRSVDDEERKVRRETEQLLAGLGCDGERRPAELKLAEVGDVLQSGPEDPAERRDDRDIRVGARGGKEGEPRHARSRSPAAS